MMIVGLPVAGLQSRQGYGLRSLAATTATLLRKINNFKEPRRRVDGLGAAQICFNPQQSCNYFLWA